MLSAKIVGALAGAAVLALSASAAVAQPKDKIKVGFIYVGPVGDHGWSYQHDQGRQAIEKAFPGKVTTTFVESVPEADSERAIEQLARTGHDLIFTTSFGFMEPTVKVAKKYPNIKFEHATGFKRGGTRRQRPTVRRPWPPRPGPGRTGASGRPPSTPRPCAR